MKWLESSLYSRVDETAKFLSARIPAPPAIGLILGTGLYGAASGVENGVEICYKDIPNFAAAAGETHGKKLVMGRLFGRNAFIMQGRFHYYDGYSLEQITFPVRVMRALGVKLLIVTNAAGGLNPAYSAGDLMIIRDHINLMGVNPLVGPNDARLGPRFPDMAEPYDRGFIKIFEAAAIDCKVKMHRGVYAALTGPCLETPAEYKFLRIIGADAVGMSTVPETIAARHAGLKVVGISAITDEASTDVVAPIDSAGIGKMMKKLSAAMSAVIREAVKKIEL